MIDWNGKLEADAGGVLVVTDCPYNNTRKVLCDGVMYMAYVDTGWSYLRDFL